MTPSEFETWFEVEVTQHGNLTFFKFRKLVNWEISLTPRFAKISTAGKSQIYKNRHTKKYLGYNYLWQNSPNLPEFIPKQKS